MNNVIIGTAGHVDHGKTSLIKALTGIDTDRLKEEKKRGITIELGFAHVDFDDGEIAGIVDVPGHEKFVKNMLAGAGGIDIALLIVAANEGVMPQTVEHFEILKLLGIDKGIIVITKTDMVENEWLQMIKEDVKELVKGSLLENAAMVETSVYKNTGIAELKSLLHGMVKDASNKDLSIPFRIPVDRIFSIDGFGTVITGTLIEGSVSKNDSIEIYPYGTDSKVRNIQVHDKDVETAFAGQRVAINLAGIKKDMVNRGCVIAKPGSMINSFMVDVFLEVLPDCGRTIKNNSRVHLYHGSRDVLCKIVLLDKDELQPGEKGYAQLRLEEESAFKYGDRYIVRFYSPLETVGGGMVINPSPRKHSRMQADIVENMEKLHRGNIVERLGVFISEKSKQFPLASEIKVLANAGNAVFDEAIKSLIADKVIVALDNEKLISAKHYAEIVAKSNEVLNGFHKKNAYKAGMNIEEYKNKVFADVADDVAVSIVNKLVSEKLIKSEALLVSIAGFAVKADDAYDITAAKIEKVYLQAGVIVPNKEDALSKINDKNKQKVFESMVTKGTLVMIDKQMFFHKTVFDECIAKMKNYIAENGDITLGQFRDIIGASRKYAVAILEYCDNKKITKKIGDSRVLF